MLDILVRIFLYYLLLIICKFLLNILNVLSKPIVIIYFVVLYASVII
jgi:hypothetical protein